MSAIFETPVTLRLARWPESVQVALLIAGPCISSVLLVGGYRSLLGLPPGTSSVMHAAWLIYSTTCWIAVGATYLWSRRRGMVGQVFAFRLPSGLDRIVALGGTALGLFVIYPFSQWLAHLLFGTGIRGMGFDAHQPWTLTAVVFWAVVSAPFCEEILFRGLAVAHLRARHWPAWAIGVAITLGFAAIHLPYFGMGGVSLILIWGGMLAAVRLWRDHLTPGWMIHAANNVVAFVVIPLLLR
jgi:membrane protease YdiL (CAAX protease family)